MIEVDPAAQTLQVYTPPSTMEGPTFVAGTVDVDGKGKFGHRPITGPRASIP